MLAAALERHPKRVIWEVDDWIFHDAPDIDSNIHLPADLYRRNARGVAGYLFSGRHGARVGVDHGAVDSAARAGRGAADQ